MTVKDGGREGNVDGQASVLLAAPSSGSFGFIELAEKIPNQAPPFVDVGVEFWWGGGDFPAFFCPTLCQQGG